MQSYEECDVSMLQCPFSLADCQECSGFIANVYVRRETSKRYKEGLSSCKILAAQVQPHAIYKIKLRADCAGPLVNQSNACSDQLCCPMQGKSEQLIKPPHHTAARACSRSLQMSSRLSTPQLKRTRLSLMPYSARFSGPWSQYEMTVGCSIRLSQPPREGAM